MASAGKRVKKVAKGLLYPLALIGQGCDQTIVQGGGLYETCIAQNCAISESTSESSSSSCEMKVEGAAVSSAVHFLTFKNMKIGKEEVSNSDYVKCCTFESLTGSENHCCFVQTESGVKLDPALTVNIR